MKALVLAAGKSTRIAALAGDLPKPLLEINGVPVLARNLKLLAAHGVRDVWVNLHHRPDEIRRRIGDGQAWGVKVSYSLEKEILGTAGAVKNLEGEFSGGTFLVLYGDNFTDCDLTSLLKQHRDKAAAVTIAAFDFGQGAHSGIAGGRIVADDQDRILRFAEGREAQEAGSPWVNAGAYALEPPVLGRIPRGFSDFGRDVFPQLLKEGVPMNLYRHAGFCLALDTPEAFERARKLAGVLP